jgi:Arc/MetJ-type ribon-helix-helix transcriptional regulator
LPPAAPDDIDFYMKKMLIEIDDRSARDLERVAPARERKRAEFVRLAIRRALDMALDLSTREAYGKQPLTAELLAGDLEGWDENNKLARPAAGPAVHRRRKTRAKRAA